METTIDRRTLLQAAAGVAAGMAASPFLSAADEEKPGKGKKVLFYTRSQAFAHDAVTRKNGEELAWGEQRFRLMGQQAGYNVTISKEGNLFTPEKIAEFDAFVFYTTGNLSNGQGGDRGVSGFPPGGKEALLKAIEEGKGFMGYHCATDTFHSSKKNLAMREEKPQDFIDPYIAMIGGEFDAHGAQQKAKIKVASTTFPGLTDIKDFEMTEEWYGLDNLAPDMHVILVQDTESMTGRGGQRERPYQRDSYPQTWARKQGKGRVFYTSLGHRTDVWDSEIFKKVTLASLAWITGNVEADVSPNLEKFCPSLVKKPA